MQYNFHLLFKTSILSKNNPIKLKDKRCPSTGITIDHKVRIFCGNTVNEICEDAFRNNSLLIELNQKGITNLDILLKKIIFKDLYPIMVKGYLLAEDSDNLAVNDIPYFNLLIKYWPFGSVRLMSSNINYNFINQKNGLKNLIKMKIRNVESTVLKHLYDSNKNYITSKKPLMIGISYNEGIDYNNRSDLFWYQNSNINPSSVQIYFEDSYTHNRYDKADSVIDKTEMLGFKWTCLYPNRKFKYWNPGHIQNKLIKEAQKLLKAFRPKSRMEKWLKKELSNVVSRVAYWYSFFKSQGIYVHYDVTEAGYENICKNIALDLLGGCSVGKERSFIAGSKGMFVGYYPNHVFFTWGRRSAKLFLNTHNLHKNILIAGEPYSSTYNVNSDLDKNKKIQKKLKKNGAKFIVLLIDNMHSTNESLGQNVYTPKMVEFYRYFLDWVHDDPEFGLIIKSKKSIIQETLPGIQRQIEQAESTGRCYNVPDPLGTKPADYAGIVNMAVSTNVFISGSLIECILQGCKGVHYDYANLKTIETDLYAWGENKVLFTELSDMVKAIKAYKNEPANNPELGDWSGHLDELDPFRDGGGGERIGTYMRWLLEGFDKGRSRDEAIEEANKLYADMWGSDKIMRGV